MSTATSETSKAAQRSFSESVTAQMGELYDTRKRLRNKMRSVTDENGAAALRAEIAALSEQIGELRREVRLCEDIETRSGIMTDKIRQAREAEKSNVKELTKNESLRGRR